MLAASSTDDITLISKKKKKKVAKTRSNDIPYQGLSSPQEHETPPFRGGTLPLENGSPCSKTAHQSYVPLKSKETEKSQKRYMRNRATATDIDSGRTIAVHSHENLTNLGNGMSASHTSGGGGVRERSNRASSLSPLRPTSVPNSNSVQPQLPPHSENRSKVVNYIPNVVVTRQQQPPHLPGLGSRGEVRKLKERFESPRISSRPANYSTPTTSQSLQSQGPGTERECRNSTENSDSGHESMVLESDTAVTIN